MFSASSAISRGSGTSTETSSPARMVCERFGTAAVDSDRPLGDELLDAGAREVRAGGREKESSRVPAEGEPTRNRRTV